MPNFNVHFEADWCFRVGILTTHHCGMVTSGPAREEPDAELKAVHVCQACGTTVERAAVEPESMISGFIKCPNCGHDGDLNIEIRGKSTKRPPARANTLKD